MTKFGTTAAALLLSVLTALPGGAAAQAACISGQQGRELLEQGQVIPFPEAMRQAGITRDQVVEVQLCEGGGGYVYRVRVLQPNGSVRPMNIPAS